nr:hypothetical protein [bacterium]
KTAQAKFETDLSDAWAKVGITRGDMTAKIEAAEKEAAGKKAEEIEELLKKKEKAAATETTETTETNSEEDDCPECQAKMPDEE